MSGLPRYPAYDQTQDFVVVQDHGAASDADILVPAFKVPAGKRVAVVKAEYVSYAGIAGHATDNFDISVKKGAVKMAAWNTDTNGLDINGGPSESTIAANTFVELTKASDATKLVVDGDDATAANRVIWCSVDESGTTSTTPGRFVLHLRYV